MLKIASDNIEYSFYREMFQALVIYVGNCDF